MGDGRVPSDYGGISKDELLRSLVHRVLHVLGELEREERRHTNMMVHINEKAALVNEEINQLVLNKGGK